MNNQESINIILANDHSLLRSGIKAGLLQKLPSLHIVAEPENFSQLFTTLKVHSEIEVLVTDDVMPNATIWDSLPVIRQQHPDLKVIVTTMHADIDYIKRLIPFCDGVVSYINAPEEIPRAITAVIDGGVYFSFSGLVNMSNQVKK